MTKTTMENLLFRSSGVGHAASAMSSLQMALHDFYKAGLTAEIEEIDELGSQLAEVLNRIVDSTAQLSEMTVTDKEPVTKTNA